MALPETLVAISCSFALRFKGRGNHFKTTLYLSHFNTIAQEGEATRPTYFNIGVVILAVFFFLFSIMLMVHAINALGYSFANYTISATSNPYIGLFIGLLATALMQSSSTATTLIVAGVASGTVSLSSAIPMVMGANIGTTLTSTIVSMGYITKPVEFRKAVAAGTIHDLFNILMVVLLFPIEMKYHLLEKGSKAISGLLSLDGVTESANTVQLFTLFSRLNDWLIESTSSLFMLILAMVLLFASIKIISKLLYNILIGKTKDKFETTVFSNTARSFGWGLFLTSAAQSSSLTTSLIVPLVATDKVKLKRAFQFILGANMGTTLTALLAALFQSEAALDIAIVHFLFNTFGVVLFIFVPSLAQLPLFLANKLGDFTLKLRALGFVYILVTFFLMPFTLIYFSQGFEERADTTHVLIED